MYLTPVGAVPTEARRHQLSLELECVVVTVTMVVVVVVMTMVVVVVTMVVVVVVVVMMVVVMVVVAVVMVVVVVVVTMVVVVAVVMVVGSLTWELGTELSSSARASSTHTHTHTHPQRDLKDHNPMDCIALGKRFAKSLSPCKFQGCGKKGKNIKFFP